MKYVGITTTVPVEILYAADYRPVDLNNILVSAPDPGHFIAVAERAGFPLNCCTWIKGLYGVCLEQGIDTVLGVTGGDCSNTRMLMETLALRGIRTIPFSYPDSPGPGKVRAALEELAALLGTTMAAAEAARPALAPARDAVLRLDDMTWRDNTVTGWENHLWLVSSSDFNGDPASYEADIRDVICRAEGREPFPPDALRLGYIGVPPVFAADLYPYVEECGGHVVFNEVQRQFAMPEPGASLTEQYAGYTYPYGMKERLRDITAEISRRRIDGIIHYVQAFCHRAIADIIFRESLGVPVLTLEGNTDFYLNTHLRTRVEAFLDMLHRGKLRAAGGRTAARR